jgi:hypothetical protein
LADVYAIRDNVGVTAGILHTASAAGWVTAGVTMAEYILFDTGATEFFEGDTLNGAGGASGLIHRIILNGGSQAWDGSGTGYVVLTGVSGGPFVNGEALDVGAGTVANADGINITFAFSPGGVYRFINHNFFGSSTSYRIYGCNGIDPAFEIDEDGVVSPILMPGTITAADTQAPTNNTPFLIEEHKGHLWLMFEGGSLQHSIPGVPLNFSGFLGAGEFGLGDEGTSLNSIVGNVLVASTTRETRGIFGSSITDWELKIVAEQSGSILFGSQKIDTVYSLDDLGITSIARSDQFGDFVNATVSQQVQPLVIAARPRFNDSTIVRESNQFRMYFNDNSFLIMYVPAGSQSESRRNVRTRHSIAEFGFGSYPIPVKSIYNTDDDTGMERTYFVTDDVTNEGFVFEDQIGKNFDGADIASYVRLAFNQVGTPAYRKKFRRVDLELNTQSVLDLRFVADLSYGAAESSSSVDDLDMIANIDVIDVIGGGGFWDIANWDEFLWDGQAISTARAELQGTGENIGFLIFNESAKKDPFIMQGITLHYDLRRLQR